MKALISPVQTNLVVQVSLDNQTFKVSEPLYWLDCPDYVVAYQYQYNEGQFIEIPLPTATAEQNKQEAISLLQQTDWTSISDVGNPQLANPYLANQAEFIAWRSQIREIAVNPVAGVFDVFGQMPQEIWLNSPK